MSEITKDSLSSELMLGNPPAEKLEPATVGLRKILRNKKHAAVEISAYRAHTPEVFVSVFSEELSQETLLESDTSSLNPLEMRIAELEQQNAFLSEELLQQKQEIIAASDDAFRRGCEQGGSESAAEAQTVSLHHEEALRLEMNERLAESLERAFLARTEYFQELEQELVGLVVAISQKIIGEELRLAPEIVVKMVQRSLEYIAYRDGIIIRVSPTERDLVKAKMDQFNRHNDGLYDLKIVGDESVSPGGCLVETNSTIVDARVDKQYKRIIDLVERCWQECTVDVAAPASSPESTTTDEVISDDVPPQKNEKTVRKKSSVRSVTGKDVKKESLLHDVKGA